MRAVLINPMTGMFLLLMIIIILAIIRLAIAAAGEPRKYYIGNAQTIGTREKQDDSFGTSEKYGMILGVVADGIGGLSDGKIASQLAVKTFLNEFEMSNAGGNISYFFEHSARIANASITQKFDEVMGGTTLVAGIIRDRMLYWSSVGDSSIAVFRNGHFIPINPKQNVETWLVNQFNHGNIERDYVLNHPLGKRLTNYIGYDGFHDVVVCDNPIPLKQKDKVILCTDGIDTLTQIELETILSQRGNIQEKADEIIESIHRKNTKNKDNATILIIEIS